MALSLLNTLKSIFCSHANGDPKNILFLELSEIGSVILGYPAMKKVQALFPHSKLYLWIFNKNKDIVPILGIFPEENVIAMREDNFLCLCIDIIKNVWRIRKERIDVIIDFELFSRFSSFLSYLSGARVRVGFYGFSAKNPYRGNLLTHKVNYNHYMHMSNNFLALAQALKAHSHEPFLKEFLMSNEFFSLQVKVNKERENAMWLKLRNYNKQIERDSKIILVHPCINDVLPIRRWSFDSYIQLANRFLSVPNIFVITIGNNIRQRDIALIEKAVPHPQCIHLVGKITIKELLGLFHISNLLISHDSGAVHLASLTAIEIIVLFGPETPLLYKPLSMKSKIFYKQFICSPCISAYNYRKSACKDNKCVSAITVDEVYNEALMRLSVL